MTKIITKKTGALLIKIIITSIFFMAILRNTDFDSTISILIRADIMLVIVAFSVLLVEVIIATARWFIVLNWLKIDISFSSTLRYLWIGAFFNQALPSSIGGDALRGYFLCKHSNCSMGDATVGVLLDRVVAMFSLTLLIIISLPLWFELVTNPIINNSILLLLSGLLVCIIIGITLDFIPHKWITLKVVRGLFVLSQKSRRIIFSRYGLILIVISFTIQLSFVFAVWILSQSMGLDVNFVDVLLIIPVTNLITVLPISIAGWGVREAVIISGFGFLGINSEAALAISIFYGLLILVSSIPGSMFWLQSKI
jgi:glycosyltransferase 2 family protein